MFRAENNDSRRELDFRQRSNRQSSRVNPAGVRNYRGGVLVFGGFRFLEQRLDKLFTFSAIGGIELAGDNRGSVLLQLLSARDVGREQKRFGGNNSHGVNFDGVVSVKTCVLERAIQQNLRTGFRVERKRPRAALRNENAAV